MTWQRGPSPPAGGAFLFFVKQTKGDNVRYPRLKPVGLQVGRPTHDRPSDMACRLSPLGRGRVFSPLLFELFSPSGVPLQLSGLFPGGIVSYSVPKVNGTFAGFEQFLPSLKGAGFLAHSPMKCVEVA
jgi:hypothetical protein